MYVCSRGWPILRKPWPSTFFCLRILPYMCFKFFILHSFGFWKYLLQMQIAFYSFLVEVNFEAQLWSIMKGSIEARRSIFGQTWTTSDNSCQVRLMLIWRNPKLELVEKSGFGSILITEKSVMLLEERAIMPRTCNFNHGSLFINFFFFWKRNHAAYLILRIFFFFRNTWDLYLE